MKLFVSKSCLDKASLSGLTFVTYGLDDFDLKRREKEKDFSPVGMNTILDMGKPKVTAFALDKARNSRMYKYVAVAVYDMRGTPKEVDFKRL